MKVVENGVCVCLCGDGDGKNRGKWLSKKPTEPCACLHADILIYMDMHVFI